MGLTLALGGPLALASLPMHDLDGLAAETTALLGQAVLGILVMAVLAVLTFGEKASLAAVGLVQPTWRSVLWGFGIGVSVFALLFAMVAALSQLGLFDNKAGAEIVLTLPAPVRFVLAAAAGVIEEILYRGYAIERLSAATGSTGLAAIIGLIAFALAHVPFWGWAGLATPLLGGGFFTALYLGRRDLISCIVAHSTIDLIGMVVVPALAG